MQDLFFFSEREYKAKKKVRDFSIVKLVTKYINTLVLPRV